MTQPADTRHRTLVVGAGVTGLSILRRLHGRDALTLIDTRGPQVLAPADRAEFAAVDMLLNADQNVLRSGLDAALPMISRAVLSPGLADDHWIVRRLRASNIPLLTDIDLFFAETSAPVIGITGTNGKSTVTTLVAELLNAVGVEAKAGGNLGPAALDLLSQPAHVYVLELSSFQLARSQCQPFQAACILNVHPDHLDYHGSLDAYAAAKQRIFAAAAHAVYDRQDPLTAPVAGLCKTSQGSTSFGLDSPAAGQLGVVEQNQNRWLAAALADGEPPVLILPCADLGIAGRHNERNALAALALVNALLPQQPDVNTLAAALKRYTGLPHRCERIAVVDGVTYINDSKATNVGATIAAVQGLRTGDGSQLLVLLGGDGKGADFSELGPALAEGVRAAFVYGADAERLLAVLAAVVPTSRCDTLTAAVDAARDAAVPGDSIVLTPACASFDQFAKFAARGDAFRRYVLELAA